MKKIALLLAILLCAVSLNAQSIEGLWNTGKENTIVKIIKADNHYEGAIYKSDNPKAPIGKMIVKEIVRNEPGYKGKIYVIQKEKWYNAEFLRTGDKLKVTVFSGYFSKTVDWYLVK